MRVISKGPTGVQLVWRGVAYAQQIWVQGQYPANLWLTYRGLRYRPAQISLSMVSTPTR